MTEHAAHRATVDVLSVAKPSLHVRHISRSVRIPVLLDEVALHREVGGPAVMREQLEHLLTMAELPDVTVQIVPGHGEYGGNSGPFTLATLEDRSEVVYADSAIRGLTFSDPEDIATVTRTLLTVRSLALPVGQSLELIRRTAVERWT